MTALQLLRFERDQKLRETDHLMIADWPISDSKKRMENIQANFA